MNNLYCFKLKKRNTNSTYILRSICLYSTLLLYRQGLIEFLPNSSTSLIMTPPIWRSPLTLRVLSTWEQKIIKLITNMNNYFGTNQSSYRDQMVIAEAYFYIKNTLFSFFYRLNDSRNPLQFWAENIKLNISFYICKHILVSFKLTN